MPGRIPKVDFTKDPDVIGRQLECGRRIAERAASMAPVDSGQGARSIRAEAVRTSSGATEVHVSWDRDAFYMLFSEIGTQHQPARPFLRPAGEQVMRG